ncbi:helix-turn-helix domain-containing protein [Streptomyces sp. NBC_00510]
MVEQRYHAVMEVAAGAAVVEAAVRHQVSRQSVHAWVCRYEQAGLPGMGSPSSTLRR